MKHLLVTGGAGYVGSVLVPRLMARRYDVRVVDLCWYGRPAFPVMRADLRDIRSVRSALRGIDAVIHLAAVSNDPSFELDPAFGKAVNHDATTVLIDAAKNAGVRRFIYASTSSVYGVKKEKNVTEDLRLEPLTDYSKYKVMCEEYLLKSQSENFTTVVLRPATVCGYSPRMRLDLTVNILTMSALVNKKITVLGGSQLRPNIHIIDMCRAYELFLTAPKNKIAGKIFNVGYQNYRVLDIAKMVKRVLEDRSIKIEIKLTDDVRSYHISSGKIKKELGFVPKHTVEEAIRDIKKAYEQGLFPNALTDPRYYNVRTMKRFYG